MAETFAGKISKLSKDLEKEIVRLGKELKEKQALLKALKGMSKFKVSRRGRKPTAGKRAKKMVVRRGRPPKKNAAAPPCPTRTRYSRSPGRWARISVSATLLKQ